MDAELQYSEQYVLEDLRRQSSVLSQKEMARKCKVTPQYLCDVLKRRRPVSETIAKALGYRRVIHFERRSK